MKKLTIILTILFVFASTANAKTVTVVLDKAYHHLGNATYKYMYNPYPEGKQWKKTFNMPEVIGQIVFVKFSLIGNNAVNLVVNGTAIGIPISNSSGGDTYCTLANHQTIIMPLPAILFKKGSNVIQFLPLPNMYDDIDDVEIGQLALIYDKE